MQNPKDRCPVFEQKNIPMEVSSKTLNFWSKLVQKQDKAKLATDAAKKCSLSGLVFPQSSSQLNEPAAAIPAKKRVNSLQKSPQQ